MKSLILALSLVAVNAFASHNEYIEYPQYDGVSVTNLCDAGSSFQTIQPLTVCDKWEASNEVGGDGYTFTNWKCVASHKEHAVVSKVGKTCVEYASTGEAYDGTCVKFGTVARSSTVSAQVINVEAGLVGFVNYTIPACSTALNPKPAK
jgi:hypothetical protein